MQEYTTHLSKTEEVADNTYKFTFERPEGFEFTAGQYVVLEVTSPAHTDDRPAFRSLSIASAPSEEGISFIMRGSESGFKKSLVAMTPGGAVTMKGPLGHCILPEGDTPVVYLVAGVGLTPARAMLKDAEHQNSEREFILIYSNREKKSAACLEEMQNIDLPNYTSICAMTNECDDWDGPCGRVDTDFIQEKTSHLDNPLFYIVGTKGFINGMKANLAELGVEKERMIIDNFG